VIKKQQTVIKVKPRVKTRLIPEVFTGSKVKFAPKVVSKVSPKVLLTSGLQFKQALPSKEEQTQQRKFSTILGLKQQPALATKQQQKLDQASSTALISGQAYQPKQIIQQKTGQRAKLDKALASIGGGYGYEAGYDYGKPITKAGIPYWLKFKKQQILEEKRRKAKKIKLRKQAIAYQPSVAAIALGIKITPQQAKKMPKVFTGLELRPQVTNDYSYAKQLQQNQDTLMFPARRTAKKGSPRKAVRMLKAQQLALLEPAYGGKEAHKKRIKKQYAEELKRIKLYKSKKAHRKALKTGKLKKRKKKKVRRKSKIIDRISKMFR